MGDFESKQKQRQARDSSCLLSKLFFNRNSTELQALLDFWNQGTRQVSESQCQSLLRFSLWFSSMIWYDIEIELVVLPRVQWVLEKEQVYYPRFDHKACGRKDCASLAVAYSQLWMGVKKEGKNTKKIRVKITVIPRNSQHNYLSQRKSKWLTRRNHTT